MINKIDPTLARRWHDGDQAALRVEALNRLVDGTPLDDLGLERVNNRWDLRGISAPPAGLIQAPTVKIQYSFGHTSELRLTAPVGNVKLEGVALRGIDFTGAILPHWRFTDVQIENCRFDGADCTKWHLRATHLRETTFVGARLADAALSGGTVAQDRVNRYERVDFRHADVSNTTHRYESYEDCDFGYANLEGINFWQATLVRCRFAGPLRHVIFDGRVFSDGVKDEPNPMLDIDMSQVTVFDDVDCRDINLDNVRLPDDHDVVLLHSVEQVDEAIKRLPEGDSEPVRNARISLQIIGNRLEKYGKGCHELIDLRGVAETAKADILREVLHAAR